MTDNEIIKALKECLTEPCSEQAYINAVRNALDLINRQKAEIERLNGCVKTEDEVRAIAAETIKTSIKIIKAEAVKEFAERLKEKQQTFIGDEYAYKFIYLIEIDNLVKEMGVMSNEKENRI